MSDPDSWIDPVTAADWRTDAKLRSKLVHLAKHEHNDGAAFSSDRRIAAYCRNGAPGNQIELIDLERGEITRFEHSDGLVKLRDLRLDDDGGKLLLTATPPLYRGVSRIVELDLSSRGGRLLGRGNDLLFRQPQNAPGGAIVTAFARAPELTRDQRVIANPQYRDAPFLKIGVVEKNSEVRPLSPAVLSDIGALSATDRGVAFATTGWGVERNGLLGYQTIEQRFPEHAQIARYLAFSLARDDAREPALIDTSVRAPMIIQRTKAAIGRHVRFAGALPDGRLIYLAFQDDYGVRRIIVDSDAAVLSDVLNVGADVISAYNRWGDIVVISHGADAPAISTASMTSARSLEAGRLKRRPTVQFNFDIDAAAGAFG